MCSGARGRGWTARAEHTEIDMALPTTLPPALSSLEAAPRSRSTGRHVIWPTGRTMKLPALFQPRTSKDRQDGMGNRPCSASDRLGCVPTPTPLPLPAAWRAGPEVAVFGLTCAVQIVQPQSAPAKGLGLLLDTIGPPTRAASYAHAGEGGARLSWGQGSRGWYLFISGVAPWARYGLIRLVGLVFNMFVVYEKIRPHLKISSNVSLGCKK